MAKSIITLSALLIALTLSGCWGDDKENKEDEKNTQKVEKEVKKAQPDKVDSAESDTEETEDVSGEAEENDDEFDGSEIDLSSVTIDTVVAKVGDEKITAKDVMDMMQIMPPEMRKMPVEILFLAIRDQLIDMKIMQAEAKSHEKKLLKKKEIQDALQKAHDQILMGAYMQDAIKNKVGEQAVKVEYKNFLAKFPTGTDEVKVHQIVVKTEEAAKAILEDLEAGVDFFKLAREKSIDKQTAEKDGEVPGYISALHKGSLLPGYDIIFKKENGKDVIPTGSYTKKPIKTPMGYFILKVMERRPLKAPKLKDLKPLLEMQLKQKALEEHMKKLREGVAIKRYHPNTGKPMDSLDAQVEHLKDMLMKAVEKEKSKIAKKDNQQETTAMPSVE